LPLSVFLYVDAVVDDYIAIIILQTGDLSMRAPIRTSSTQPLMLSDRDSGPVQTRDNELTSLHYVNTTSDISPKSVTSSDQTQAPSLTTDTRNDSSQKYRMFDFERVHRSDDVRVFLGW